MSFIFCFLFISCSHQIPTANLNFDNLTRHEKYVNYYFLNFYSDTELIQNLKEKHLGARFRCVLERESDRFVFSSFKPFKLLTKKSDILFEYQVDLTFKNDSIQAKDNFSRQRILQKEAISHVFQLQDSCLECEVYAISYMGVTKPYHSKVMCLPKKNLLEASTK